jgi:hypothetical protein
MDLTPLTQRFREQYGDEYTRFLLLAFAEPPFKCPSCQAPTIRMLWLGDPEHPLGDSVWGKWYLWCESCLRGIYCPLGTYAVPRNEPYIRWGDKVALKRALPPQLRLIQPVGPAGMDEKQNELQKLFDMARGRGPTADPK